MSFLKGNSIQNKFTFGIAIVITLIMVVFSIATIYYNSKSIERDLENQLNRLTVLSTRSLGSAIWQYNNDYVEEYIESLFLYEDLVYASVLSDTDRIGTRTHPDYHGMSYEDFLSNNNFIATKTAVVYGEIKVGEVLLVMSRERIFDLIFITSAISVLMLLVLNIAIFTSTLILNKRYVFNPLFSLENAVKSISSGNLEAPIDTTSQDEIGNLARAFYQMMKNLKLVTASRDELNHEVTERKKAEQQLEEYKNILEIKVTERTQELKKTQELMLQKEKLATIGRLSGSVAHDIRNPLGAIGNSVYYLQQTSGKIPEEKQIKHLKLMEREINRANEIITDLMNFSKENKPVFQRENMNIFLKEVINDFRFPDDVSVELDLKENLPSPLFDPSQFQRIFINLILNAVQAMPDGGQLYISSNCEDNFIIVQFKDTGSGIADDDYQKIFDALYTTKPKGVGLGLSIVKSFIDKHNAKIEVQSEADHGATFTICLPIDQV